MKDYYDNVTGKRLTDIADRMDFQDDLITFFKSPRYGMSDDEINQMTANDLVNDFAEHMRYQETNEATVAMDYNFVNRAKQQGDQETLDAFGRLMMAWDNSEGAGTGKLEGAWDYSRAVLSSPSTLITIGTAGLGGPVAKFGAQAGKHAGQIALRKLLTDTFTKQVAGKVVAETAASTALKQGLGRAAVVGAARGAAIEGTLQAGVVAGQEDLRAETIEDREIDWGKVATNAAVSSVVGGAFGAAGRAYSIRQQNNVIDDLATKGLAYARDEAKGLKEAARTLGRITKGNTKENPEFTALLKQTEELISTMTARNARGSGGIRRALDQDTVKAGEDIARSAFTTNTDEAIMPGLSTNTLRKVGAATVDISNTLGFKLSDDVRISERVAEGLSNGSITTNQLEEIMSRYNLSKAEFSYVFLAEMSRAGRTLNLASQMAKSADKAAAQETLKNFTTRLQDFTARGITSVDDEALAKFSQNLQNATAGKGSGVVQTLREIDAARIGIMVSQPATTARNVTTSLGRVGADISDRMFTNLLEGRNPLNNAFSAIKGMTWGKDEAIAIRLLATADPDSDLARIFQGYTRVENGLESNSVLSRAVNTLNYFNTITDTQFKQTTFYSSLQRSLANAANDPKLTPSQQASLPNSVRGFLNSGRSLESLPKHILDKARREALSTTFQRGYEDAVGLTGQSARALIQANYKYPFLISAGVGVPFPRYLANQMEFIHKYGPTGVLENAYRVATGKGTGDALESMSESLAKSATGTFLLGTAIGLRMNAGEGTKYNELLNEEGDVVDVGPSSGPYQAHLFVGDMIARHARGEPVVPSMGVTARQATEILTGLNLFGYGSNTLTTMIDSFEQGFDTEQLQKWLADVVATFTLPAAPLRDVTAQFIEDAAPNPYTRNIDPENQGGLGVFKARATRFLPDYSWVQYTASFNKDNDIPLYSGFNKEPVQRVNPILNQMLGMPISVKRNALQREMVNQGIEEYVMLGSRRIRNPNTDYVVRQVLSEVLPRAYEEEFLKNNFSTDRNVTITYEDLPREQQELELRNFISETISAVSEDVENRWQAFAREKPTAASGWIMNNYAIKAKQYNREIGSLDRVLPGVMLKSGEKEPESVAEFLDGAETVVERLARMQEVLRLAENIADYDREARK